MSGNSIVRSILANGHLGTVHGMPLHHRSFALLAIFVAIFVMLSTKPSPAQERDEAVPTREAFELYERVARGEGLDQGVIQELLAVTDEAGLRLDLARSLIGSGDAEAALVILVPLLERFAATDPAMTETLDLIAAAHRMRGDAATALRASLLAYDAALARLGETNPRLFERLDALALFARENGLPELVPIEAERARIAALPKDPPDVRALGRPIAMEIWFGTNRVDLGGHDPGMRFGVEAGDLSVGRLTVTIPPGHRTGMIERPSIWSVTGHADPMRHVVLADIETIAREAFADGCCGQDDRLLFIHGYNVSFHDGALRAAQLAFDLEFRGQPMYFSWPSRSSLLGYLSDSNGVLASRPALVEFMELATRGSGKLHIIAHSMGNRYLLEAMEVFLRDHPDRDLGQLVLGAPDVDRNELAVRMELLRTRTAGVTLYASRNDWALNVSRRIHGAHRAGDIGGEPVRIAGLATLDASEIAADTLGHSYFGDATQVLGDILGLIRLELPPGERCGTAPREEPIWAIRPDGCPVEVVRTASDLIDLFGASALEEAQARRDDGAGEDLDFWLGVMAVVADRLQPAVR